MNSLIHLEWSHHSPRLSLGATYFSLTNAEQTLLRSLLSIYQDEIGWYDMFELINRDFEQSGCWHSKQSFLDWAKKRNMALIDQYENRISNDVWNDKRREDRDSE